MRGRRRMRVGGRLPKSSTGQLFCSRIAMVTTLFHPQWSSKFITPFASRICFLHLQRGSFSMPRRLALGSLCRMCVIPATSHQRAVKRRAQLFRTSTCGVSTILKGFGKRRGRTLRLGTSGICWSEVLERFRSLIKRMALRAGHESVTLTIHC